MVESIVDMHDCNVSTGSESRIHFVNYRSLGGIGRPVWGPRRLSDFEMILSLRGEFEFVNCETGEQVRQHPGEILTIRPGEEHVYRLIGDPAGAFFSCIHLDPGDETETPPRLVAFPPDQAMPELFRRADRLFHYPGRRGEALLSALGRVIWLYLFEPSRGVGGDGRFDSMIDFLERHLTEHPTRLDLAREFHLTPQRINALFKAQLGISPGEYVHRELAERGYTLLHDEQLSVKEAADRLGFSTPFYFSRVFRNVFGVPPSAVRGNSAGYITGK